MNHVRVNPEDAGIAYLMDTLRTLVHRDSDPPASIVVHLLSSVRPFYLRQKCSLGLRNAVSLIMQVLDLYSMRVLRLRGLAVSCRCPRKVLFGGR